MRILHVLDHSLPLHSGYAFRTLAILREQRALGWETLQLTTPRHGRGRATSRTSTAGASTARRCGRARWSGCPGRLRCRRCARPRAVSRGPSRVRAGRPARAFAGAERAAGAAGRTPARHAGRLRGARAVGGRRGRPRHDARGQPALPRDRARSKRYALRRADHVTTICEGLRDDIVARGVAADRDHRHPERRRHRRVPLRRASRRRAARAARARRQATVVGFAGSFYAYEGLDSADRRAGRC